MDAPTTQYLLELLQSDTFTASVLPDGTLQFSHKKAYVPPRLFHVEIVPMAEGGFVDPLQTYPISISDEKLEEMRRYIADYQLKQPNTQISGVGTIRWNPAHNYEEDDDDTRPED